MFHYNCSEQKVADDIFGLKLVTVRNLRRQGKIPDYLYTSMVFNGARSNVRYCEPLLMRWRTALNEGEAAAKTEEIRARAQLAKQLEKAAA